MTGARRAAAIIILAAIPPIAAAQLNPIVKVLPRAKTVVPAECEDGLAPQPAQRLTTEERTAVRDTSRDMQAPPSVSLRSELQRAFESAQHNSRDAFRDALIHAKSMLTSYPPGGERTAAANLVDVLDDVDKTWDYEFTSPTGAFFDATTEPFRVASKYPGWQPAIRRQIITDQNGNKFYPTHETRDFLLSESGQRLTHVTGKPAPALVSTARGTTTISGPEPRVTTTTAASTPSVKPAQTTKPKPHHTMKQTTTTTTTRSTQPSHHRRTHKPVVREARTKTEPVTASTHATPPAHATPPPPPPRVRKSTPPPATAATSRKPVITETVTETRAPIVATTSSATTRSTDTASTTTQSTTYAAGSPETTETSSTTSTTETTTSGKPAQPRSLFGPILLIIIGIGLLLTLWRASS